MDTQNLSDITLERAAVAAMIVSDAAYQEILRYCNPKDFHHFGDLVEAVRDIRRSGEEIDRITLPILVKKRSLETFGKHGGEEMYASIVEAATFDPENAVTYAREIKELAVRRGLVQYAKKMAVPATQGVGLAEIMAGKTAMDAGLSAALSQLNGGTPINPGTRLERIEGGFSIRTGIESLDSLLRMTSGGLHSIGGDPSSGKTTLGAQITIECLKDGYPVHVMLVEDTALEFQLNMLSMVGAIDAYQANMLLVSDEYRTPEVIRKVTEAWEEHFGEASLFIHIVHGGPENVSQILEGISSSVIVVDHIFAIVSQRVDSKFQTKDHQTAYRLLSDLQHHAQRTNSCTIAFNQYTRSARQDKKRGGESHYGGTGTLAIAKTMINMRTAEGVRNDQYLVVYFEVIKVKKRIVVDGAGNTINPVGREGMFYIMFSHRSIKSAPPTISVRAEEIPY